MRIDKEYRIEKTACADRERRGLCDAYLDADDLERPVLVSTDLLVMAIVPVTLDDDDTTGNVPLKALDLARKEKRDALYLSANGDIKLGNDVSMPRGEGVFPDYKRLSSVPGEVTREITLNPNLLLRACQAIGISKSKRDGVTLVIRGDMDPIIVKPSLRDGTVENKAYAIVMPMRP